LIKKSELLIIEFEIIRQKSDKKLVKKK
jgi:hypothetical protein